MRKTIHLYVVLYGKQPVGLSIWYQFMQWRLETYATDASLSQLRDGLVCVILFSFSTGVRKLVVGS